GNAAHSRNPAAAIYTEVGFDEFVDDHPHGDAADLLGTASDLLEPETLGVRARHQQQHFPGSLVVAGAARSRQLGAEVDQMLAHGIDRLDPRGLGPGAKDDGYSRRAAIGDGFGA